MKTFTSIYLHYLRNRASRRNLRVLAQFFLVLFAMVVAYSVLFHYLMALEGREYSWITGAYWTLTVMSTLGFGDITFASDLGLVFSMVVLLTGMVFMLTLLPFTFIQFFYAPWMEAQSASRAPRELPEHTSDHVVVTHYDPIATALIKKLSQYHHAYVIVIPDITEALRLHDLGLQVAVGDLDDPETYRKLRVPNAALVATTHNDVLNTNIAFTVREVSPDVPIVATAASVDSEDILSLAGCTRVLQLAEMLGQALARRVIGRDAQAHVIGRFDGLLIAEATAAGTPLVDRKLSEIRLRDHVNVIVAGVWERGRFETAGPDTKVTASTVLVLAGSRQQLDDYNGLFCIYRISDEPVVILGGGRVGLATARGLAEQGFDYRIVERDEERIGDEEHYIHGNAAELATLKRAGIMESSAVVITTNDDSVNVYLTLYCRRLRSDIQIISRATLDRTVETLHRAGADFVISEASMGANAVFNLLHRSDILLLAEGLDVFKVPVPPALAGKSLAESDLRQKTGCSVIAIDRSAGGVEVNPPPHVKLPAGDELIVIGSAESEQRFLDRYLRK